MPPQAVIFDMDGLLLDTERLSEKSFRACCEQFNLGFDTALFAELTGQSGPAHLRILNRYLPDIAEEFDSRWKQIYHELLADGVPVKAGIPAFLEKIKAAHIRLAVATSSRTDKAHRYLDMAGLASYFSHILGSDLVTHAKPAPDIYLLAVELLAVSATSCMVLEDSNNGVAAALASQIRTIHLPDTQIPAKAFAENPQYLHADTLAMAERLIFQAE